MPISLRSSLVAGVAAVGAGVIAAGPTAPPAPVATPQRASTDVSLGAAILQLPSVPDAAAAGSTLVPTIGRAVAAGADRAIAPVNSAAQALPTPPFVPPGVQLSFLTGSPNLGAGNEGNFNTGFNNDGDFNTGTYNEGNFNIGGDNEGDFNIGFNNVDDMDNVAVANIGNGNDGDFNVGFNNRGVRNFGSDNTGALNLGLNNTGNFNVGIGNTGNGNIGFFNSGDNHIGVANVGVRYPNPLTSSATQRSGGGQAVSKQD
jgi:hypothetical protein